MHIKALDFPTAAAVPALVSSLLLMQMAGVPMSALIQQGSVGALAIAAVVVHALVRPRAALPAGATGLLFALAACVWLPLLHGTPDTPSRWIGLFGFRLYIASVVLPTFVLLFLHAVAARTKSPALPVLALVVMSAGLFIQPDAPQLLALAIGCAPLFLMSRPGWGTKVVVLALLLPAAAMAWRAPVALQPVPYVEGVFAIAAGHSLWMGSLAVLLAALPCIALARVAGIERRPEALGACLYFTVLFLLSPLQVTPVPLLGFGAGPVLGYFLMVATLRGIRSRATSP